MLRLLVDPQKTAAASAAVAAVRDSTIRYCRAAEVYVVSVGSIQERFNGVVSMDLRTGYATALMREE